MLCSITLFKFTGVILLYRGFYTAASGMISQQRHTEMISNNIANANTPGYKAEQTALRSFPELLIQQMGSKNIPTQHGFKQPVNRLVGGLHTGVYAQELVPNFTQGPIRETGIETDFAIVDGDMPDETGSIFFTVQNEAGAVRYTRNGHFTIDGEGYVTTNEGFYVLDAAGNRIHTDGQNFTVTADGTIQMENANTPLGLVYIANTNDLVKEVNDLYNPEPGNTIAVAPATAGATYTVQQRFLESSNVNPLQSMTDMIQAYRNFEMNQRVLKAYDESMGKAVNDIARLG